MMSKLLRIVAVQLLPRLVLMRRLPQLPSQNGISPHQNLPHHSAGYKAVRNWRVSVERKLPWKQSEWRRKLRQQGLGRSRNFVRRGGVIWDSKFVPKELMI